MPTGELNLTQRTERESGESGEVGGGGGGNSAVRGKSQHWSGSVSLLCSCAASVFNHAWISLEFFPHLVYVAGYF